MPEDTQQPMSQAKPAGPAASCSALSDFEKGPWSYDLYADGLHPVGLLNNPDHILQGEWVDIEDYRKLERELDEARAECQRLRNSMENVRDTAQAMKDSLRCYPKGGTVIIAEGPERLHKLACESLYPQARNARNLESEMTQLRDSLHEILLIAEHGMPMPSHKGPCGPWAQCDGDCAARAHCAEAMDRAAKLLTQNAEVLAPAQQPTKNDN